MFHPARVGTPGTISPAAATFIEPLEQRQLLSASAVETVVPPQARPAVLARALRVAARNDAPIINLDDEYRGTLRVTRNTVDPELSRRRPARLVIDDQLNRRVIGTLVVDGVGAYDVTGVLDGRRLTAIFVNGDIGTFRATVSKNGNLITGQFADLTGGDVVRGTMRLRTFVDTTGGDTGLIDNNFNNGSFGFDGSFIGTGSRGVAGNSRNFARFDDGFSVGRRADFGFNGGFTTDSEFGVRQDFGRSLFSTQPIVPLGTQFS